MQFSPSFHHFIHLSFDHCVLRVCELYTQCGERDRDRKNTKIAKRNCEPSRLPCTGADLNPIQRGDSVLPLILLIEASI
jgi:hypothetical protein